MQTEQNQSTETPADDTNTPPKSDAAPPPSDDTPPADDAGEKVNEDDQGGNETALEIPEAYRGENGEADVAKLIERAKFADALSADRPDDPSGYKIDLGDDIKGPDGKPLVIDAENPILQEYLKEAHEKGLGAAAVTENIKFFARGVTDTLTNLQAERQKQIDQVISDLGDKAEARFKAVDSFIAGVAGKEGASAILGEVSTKTAFEALEALAAAANGGTPQKQDGGAGEGGKRSLHDRLFGN